MPRDPIDVLQPRQHEGEASRQLVESLRSLMLGLSASASDIRVARAQRSLYLTAATGVSPCCAS